MANTSHSCQEYHVSPSSTPVGQIGPKIPANVYDGAEAKKHDARKGGWWILHSSVSASVRFSVENKVLKLRFNIGGHRYWTFYRRYTMSNIELFGIGSF
jgi:hypothetical protein